MLWDDGFPYVFEWVKLGLYEKETQETCFELWVADWPVLGLAILDFFSLIRNIHSYLITFVM